MLDARTPEAVTVAALALFPSPRPGILLPQWISMQDFAKVHSRCGGSPTVLHLSPRCTGPLTTSVRFIEDSSPPVRVHFRRGRSVTVHRSPSPPPPIASLPGVLGPSGRRGLGAAPLAQALLDRVHSVVDGGRGVGEVGASPRRRL